MLGASLQSHPSLQEVKIYNGRLPQPQDSGSDVVGDVDTHHHESFAQDPLVEALVASIRSLQRIALNASVKNKLGESNEESLGLLCFAPHLKAIGLPGFSLDEKHITAMIPILSSDISSNNNISPSALKELCLGTVRLGTKGDKAFAPLKGGQNRNSNVFCPTTTAQQKPSHIVVGVGCFLFSYIFLLYKQLMSILSILLHHSPFSKPSNVSQTSPFIKKCNVSNKGQTCHWPSLTVMWPIIIFSLNSSQRCEAALAISPLSFIQETGRPMLPSPFTLFNSANDKDTKNIINIKPPPLTVIIPAYNESLRIEETLLSYHSFLSSSTKWQQSSQIVVVDDGSTDGTAGVVHAVSSTLERRVPVECVSLYQNQGKGAAVARGVQLVAAAATQTHGLVLIADADASADICCLDNLYDSLSTLIVQHPQCSRISTTDNEQYDWSLPALVVGRRTNDIGGDGGATTAWDRAALRWGFRTAVRTLCGDLGISDTQCGFKLLTLAAGSQLYRDLHLQGWSHDVEVLYRVKRKGIPVTEQDVLWEDKAGSKLVTSAGGTVGASLKMLVEISQLRPLYTLGIWK